jgi:hypothetical protein
MVEQPPSSTARELAEYLSRQFDNLFTGVNNLVNKPGFAIPEPLTVIDLFVTGLATFTGQILSTKAWDAATGAGQLFLNGITGNRIEFNNDGLGPPTLTTRSAGTKLVLRPNLSATIVDYAIGIQTEQMWLSVPNSTSVFAWFGGTSTIATLSGAGNMAVTGSILSSGPTAGIGYTTGAGITVAQATSKVTPVTVNGICGLINTAANALLAGATATFVVNNTAVSNLGCVVITAPNNGNYTTSIGYAATGGFSIRLTNISSGTLSESVGISFVIIKGVTS